MRKLPKKHSGIPPRTLRILSCIGEGYSTKEIATEMCLSEKTIDGHHLGVLNDVFDTRHNRAKLVRIALAFGISTL